MLTGSLQSHAIWKFTLAKKANPKTVSLLEQKSFLMTCPVVLISNSYPPQEQYSCGVAKEHILSAILLCDQTTWERRSRIAAFAVLFRVENNAKDNLQHWGSQEDSVPNVYPESKRNNFIQTHRGVSVQTKRNQENTAKFADTKDLAKRRGFSRLLGVFLNETLDGSWKVSCLTCV